MGCCASSETGAAQNNASNGNTAKKPTTLAEKKVELAFRTKRANIFTEGMTMDEDRDAFVQKRIAKSEQQQKIISKLWIMG